MNVLDSPQNIVWDVTYACPLRCIHCYSESGRRPARQLGRDGLNKVADALIGLSPRIVTLAGGEPLVVPGILDVAERMADAGIAVIVYTGGWSLPQRTAERLVQVCRQVAVSLDGATAAVHDRIRGRRGSFGRALNALAVLDEAVRAADRRTSAELAVDCVVVRSNLGQVREICTSIVPQFPGVGAVNFGPAVPAGLASRGGFADHELLPDDEVARLAGAEFTRELQEALPSSVAVFTTDNLALQMHPDRIARGEVFSAMQVEPDGAVRAMPIYEGTVGNLLDEPARALWARAVARWHDPFVVETLAPVRTMADWAAATRRIDRHFGTPDVRARIDARKAFDGG